MSNNKIRKPTDILKKDHKMIMDIIKILEACAGTLEEGGKCDLDLLKNGMDMIKNFTHKYHRRMEDSVLFKIAEKKDAPWGGGNISSMLREHEEGAERVRDLADILKESVKEGTVSKKTRKAIIKNLYGYSSLLSSHLMREEKILYPLIENLLTKQEKTNILRTFERFDLEAKEIGEKDRYSDLIKKFKKRLDI